MWSVKCLLKYISWAQSESSRFSILDENLEQNQFHYLLMYLWGRLSITEGNSSNILRTIIKLILYPPLHISTLSLGILGTTMSNVHEHLEYEHLEYGHLEYWHLDGAVPSIEKRDQWPRVHWSIWDRTPARWKLTSNSKFLTLFQNWDHDIELDKIVSENVEDCLNRLSKIVTW